MAPPLVDSFVVRANIARFRLMLETALEPEVRKTIERLLSEEERKLDTRAGATPEALREL